MIYPTSDGEEFGFHKCYLYGMVNRFGNDFLFPIYIRDQGSYFILNTSICNDKHSVLIYERILKDIIESVSYVRSTHAENTSQ